MTTDISVLAELERIGYVYDWSNENEIKCKCPFHEDQSPSCNINVQKRVFKCHTSGCGKDGDFVTFLARALKTSRAVVLADLGTRYTLDVSKVVDPQVVERYHAALWKAGPLLKELYDRGVTDKLIRKYRLGERDGRVTIPIKNAGGLFVNVRRYLPGAPGKDKMRNTRGHGAIRLYPLEQLQYDQIVLCGGEIKAIVAADKLNRHGIGAVTATAGEGNWQPALSSLFQGKKVWVCMDVDKEGQKAAKEHCTRLYHVASWIGSLLLPLDIDKYPHGDINDFVASGGRLKTLLKDVEQWHPTIQVEVDEGEPQDVDLTSAINAKNTGRRIRLQAVISAMDTAPYIIPKEVAIDCSKDQKECGLCPVFISNSSEFFVHPESPAILEMIASPRSTQREAIMRSIGIPLSCKVCDPTAATYYNVEDARISPRLEITNRTADRVMQPAMCIGGGVELNESYSLMGRMHPHPKTQQSTLLISEYQTTQDALSTYECKEVEKLTIFQPTAWDVQSIQARLDSIYADFEANVTRIFQRRDLHLTVDLGYHSPLFLMFDGRVVKGWTEVLVLGDSAQGKSETALNLMKHYNLGEKVECKNATVAGLLGGLQQLGSRWFVTWGVVPTHDKRLVILEELKGASVEVIARLTDMRSSGIAEIPKIEKRRTHARTRLIALSNSRSGMQLNSYNFGIEAIRELIGSLEDVRRFDFCLLVSALDIDPNTLNVLQRSRPEVKHVYTQDLSRALILWAWTRSPAEVVFDPEAMNAVLDSATSLSEEFTDAIPIIDRGSCRYKIARLAAALAARTFSCSEDMRSLRVRKCHIEYIVKFLQRVYSSDVFGYADFTQAVNLTHNLIDPDRIKEQINSLPFPKDFVKQILHTDKIDVQDIQDWCGWDRLAAQPMTGFLVRKHSLVRDGRSYRKTPPFIRLLKGMLDHDEITDRPDFIPEEF